MPNAEIRTERPELIQRLESSVANWQSELREHDLHVAKLPGAVKGELKRTLDELATRWAEVRAQVDELRSSGEKTLDSAWESALGRYRELVSLGQRVSEKVLVANHHCAHERYFLSPSPHGGWDLKKVGASHPLRHFKDKRSALAYSSRYVRQREPSVLVIRRQDGTFQQTRTYGSVESPDDADRSA